MRYEKNCYSIQPKKRITSIYFQKDLFCSETFLSTVATISKNVMIITDHTVLKLYGKKLQSLLIKSGFNAYIYSFAPGEGSKTRDVKQAIEDDMLKNKLLKNSSIIALGGGVVTDLAGFVASTYLRSIPYISIPTTLLCAVDASIGGKTAINTSFGKNLIGTLYDPAAIFIDPHILYSCSEIEMKNGLAEVIKYGLISNQALFESLKQSVDLWKDKNIAFLEKLISISQKEKIQVIQKDHDELGLRKTLNFGHTIGHAIERCSNYSISHGFAISIGMIAESYLSTQMGYLSEKDFFDICEIFNLYAFPLTLSKSIKCKDMLNACVYDKKNTKDGIGIVMLKKIGSTKQFSTGFVRYFDIESIEKLCQWVVNRFSLSNAKNLLK